MSTHVSESSGTGDAVDAPSATPHGRRSKVWEHFEQDLVIVGDVPKAVCKYCAMKLTCTRRSGTSSLLNHISESCRLVEAEVRAGFLATLKKKPSDVGFVLGKRKLEEEFARYRSRRRANTQPRSELDAYLDEVFIESSVGTTDILTWWKSNAEKYPVLSAMARDFLAVPLSTVSSESAFSCGGRILGDTRASLKPHALEALVCGKDWLLKVPSNEGSNTGGPSSEFQVQELDGQIV